MFYLVRFDDLSTGIYSGKCIRQKSGNMCVVKHNGCKFQAMILRSSDSKEALFTEQTDDENVENDVGCTDISTIDFQTNFPNISTSIIYNVGKRGELIELPKADAKENHINVLDDRILMPSTCVMSTPNPHNRPTELALDVTKIVEVSDNSTLVNCRDSDGNASSDLYSSDQYLSYIENITRNFDFTYSIPYESSSVTPGKNEASDANDPEYYPVENSSEISKIDSTSSIPVVITTTIRLSDEINVPGLIPCKVTDMRVDASRGRSGAGKTNFCYYCHKKQTKIARHLELKHKEEQAVNKFIQLPKGTEERKNLIEEIRKKGNYLFNTDGNYNDGELIVTRRPNIAKCREASDFKACGKCKAYFSKHTLRTHFAKCAKVNSSKTRAVLISSRKVMGRVHSRASKAVREQLLPPLRDDDLVQIIRYDEIIMLYANKMVEKYREKRHFEMIRQRLRLIARFLRTIRILDPGVTDLASVFDPKFIDNTSKAISIEAKLNEATHCYETPTVAFSLGSLLKQVGGILINDSIKKHATDKKIDVENYLKLLNEEVQIGVNRIVSESQFQIQRRKKVNLPQTDDIKCLHVFLTRKRLNAFKEIQNKFSHDSWMELAKSTLISVQLFNRRRAGEVERILINDFKSYQGVEFATDKELFQSLTPESQELAKKYVRFAIRGKLNRNVPVLIDQSLLQCIETLLDTRNAAGVPCENPYVFGIPSQSNQHKYLRACNLMRQYSVECGAKDPLSLRGTKLRKHIATTCVTLNLTSNEVADVANFMGHDEKIHKNFYRQPLVAREITRMSKILEIAQGVNDDNDTDSDQEIESQQKTEVESEESELILPKKKRSTSPYGSVKRTRWSKDEKKTVLVSFKEVMKQRKLPSLKDIQIAINSNPCLKNRTSAQIKTWIHNQYKVKKKLLSSDEDD